MNDILTTLATNVVKVVFIKVDGTERTMVCTRDLGRVPTHHHPKGAKMVDLTKAIPVFELVGDGQWRSFKPGSVVSFEVV